MLQPKLRRNNYVVCFLARRRIKMHVSYINLQILYCYAQWDPMNDNLSSIFSGTSIITFFVFLHMCFRKMLAIQRYNIKCRQIRIRSLPRNSMARIFNMIFMTTATLICVDVKSICRSSRWGLVLPKRDWLTWIVFLKFQWLLYHYDIDNFTEHFY